jgi:hypothetical protein
VDSAKHGRGGARSNIWSHGRPGEVVTTIHVLYYVIVRARAATSFHKHGFGMCRRCSALVMRAPSWVVLVQLYVFWSPMKSSAFFLEIIRHSDSHLASPSIFLRIDDDVRDDATRRPRGHNLLP